MSVRPSIVRLAAASLAVIGTACLDIPGPVSHDSQIRVINAAGAPIDIIVDGSTQLSGAAVSSISSVLLASGAHQVRLLGAGNSSATVDIKTEPGQVTTTYAYAPTPTTLNATVLDTGGVVPAGKSKLRVSHLSKLAGDIEIWRTQPDFQTPVRIQTPFPYLATSPFLQSNAGVWEVFVTRPGSTTRLLSTGPIDIPATGKRTVVLLDSANVIIFRVLTE